MVKPQAKEKISYLDKIISDRSKGLRASPTLKTQDLKAELEGSAEWKDKGWKVIDLGVGEPDETMPLYIIDTAIEVLNGYREKAQKVAGEFLGKALKILGLKNEDDIKGLTRYGSTGGRPKLKANIIYKLQDENLLDYSNAQEYAVTVTNGGKQAIFNALAATINPANAETGKPADEVLIPEPSWVSYPDMVKFLGGKPVGIETDAEFKVDPDTLRKKLSLNDNIKWLMLNSPSNPTGAVYTQDELKKLARVVVDVNKDRLAHNKPPVMVMSDDIYEHMVYNMVYNKECLLKNKYYDQNDPHSKPYKNVSANIINADPELQSEMKKYALIINGVAKAFAMTGARVGYAAGPKKLIKAMEDIQGLTTSSVNNFAQAQAIIALDPSFKKEREKTFEDMQTRYQTRMNIFEEGLRSAPDIKWEKAHGAFYAFADFSKAYGKTYKDDGVTKVILSGEDVAQYLIKKAKVMGVGGDSFFINTVMDENRNSTPRDKDNKPRLLVRFSVAANDNVLRTASNEIAKFINELKPPLKNWTPPKDMDPKARAVA